MRQMPRAIITKVPQMRQINQNHTTVGDDLKNGGNPPDAQGESAEIEENSSEHRDLTSAENSAGTQVENAESAENSAEQPKPRSVSIPVRM